MGMPIGYIVFLPLLCIYRDYIQSKILDPKVASPWTRRSRKAQVETILDYSYRDHDPITSINLLFMGILVTKLVHPSGLGNQLIA